jgi:NodT family efflux transporter outer membrane factor (OMF) lipoprotein
LQRGVKWWEVFRDVRLNAYEEQMAAKNHSLRKAAETYLAARSLVTAAHSDLEPSVGISATPTHTQLSHHKPNSSSSTKHAYNDLLLAGTASWEPDFWGAIRRSIEASQANAQASAAQMAAVQLSLEAELATDYFQLRGLDSDTKLLNTTVENLERQFALTKNRKGGGVATDADVAQAETQLHQVRAQLVDVQASRAVYEHAIGTLIDQDLSKFEIPLLPLGEVLPKIPYGVPSELLERRPDIAEQERLTAAANAQIGVARAAFYPSIILGGSGGFESTHGGTWLQGPSSLWSLGLQLSQVLFDGGKRRALSDQAQHLYEAQAETYRETVCEAFRDVEDDLSQLRIYAEEQQVQESAVASAQKSFDISNQRYKGGVATYLEVLTAENALLSSQRSVVSLQSRRYALSVQLIRALGGGWSTTRLP